MESKREAFIDYSNLHLLINEILEEKGIVRIKSTKTLLFPEATSTNTVVMTSATLILD